MMPQQRFEGAYLHRTLGSMAAAYLFHLVQNHAFVDGNKRVGVLSALVFLHVNGVKKLPAPNALQAATLRVASGTMTKRALVEWMEAHVGRRKA